MRIKECKKFLFKLYPSYIILYVLYYKKKNESYGQPVIIIILFHRGIPKEPVSPDKIDKAEMAFKLYDRDKDGFVTKSEMDRIARQLTREQIDMVDICKYRNYSIRLFF